jgi:hypothetical protein
MLSANLQGGSDEEADGTMHCARSFRAVRDSDFVALVAKDNPFSGGRQRRCSRRTAAHANERGRCEQKGAQTCLSA